MIKEPYLKNYHPSVQLLVFFGIIFVSLLAFNLIAFLVIQPFFGIDIMAEGTLEDFSDENALAARKTLASFIQIGLFIVPCIVFSKLVSYREENYLRTDQNVKPGILGIVFLIAVFSIPVINFLSYLNHQMDFPTFFGTEEEDKFQIAVMSSENFFGFIGNIFVFAVLPAIGEELFFRSVLLRFFFRSSRNVNMAVITGGLIFAFMHFQPQDFIPIATMGILYGYIFFRTGIIWYSVAAHFINNLSVIIFQYLTVTGQVKENLNAYGTGENETIPLVISFLLLTGSVLLLFKKADGQEMKNSFY